MANEYGMAFSIIVGQLLVCEQTCALAPGRKCPSFGVEEVGNPTGEHSEQLCFQHHNLVLLDWDYQLLVTHFIS